MQEEHDGISKYRLCRVCGHLEHLTATGAVYVPPATLDPEDAPKHQGSFRGPNRNSDHQPRIGRDGCAVHDHCLTCPLPACVVSDRGAYVAILRRRAWFGGKAPEDITAADIQAEPCSKRSAYRRLAALRSCQV